MNRRDQLAVAGDLYRVNMIHFEDYQRVCRRQHWHWRARWHFWAWIPDLTVERLEHTPGVSTDSAPSGSLPAGISLQGLTGAEPGCQVTQGKDEQ